MKKEFENVKASVNGAIYDVITNQYKKDCKDSHQLVEDAGYKITKIEGGWRVDNLETGKYVYTSGKYSWYNKGYKVHRNTYFGKCAYISEVKANCRFDFVACLDCERKVFYPDFSRYPNKALEQWDILYNAKWSLKFDKQCLEDTKKKIEALQKDLIRYSGNIVRSENNLKEVRKELGLAN